MLVRCYWCISILIIIPTIRCCSLTVPLCGCSAVVLSHRRYPSFRNFDSTISIDVIRVKSYTDSLFDPTSKRLTNFFPNRKMPRFVSVLRNCGGLRARKPYISAEFWLRNVMLVIRFSCCKTTYIILGSHLFSESLTLPTCEQTTDLLFLLSKYDKI